VTTLALYSLSRMFERVMGVEQLRLRDLSSKPLAEPYNSALYNPPLLAIDLVASDAHGVKASQRKDSECWYRRKKKICSPSWLAWRWMCSGGPATWSTASVWSLS
jgi:hypothetical protein